MLTVEEKEETRSLNRRNSRKSGKIAQFSKSQARHLSQTFAKSHYHKESLLSQEINALKEKQSNNRDNSKNDQASSKFCISKVSRISQLEPAPKNKLKVKKSKIKKLINNCRNIAKHQTHALNFDNLQQKKHKNGNTMNEKNVLESSLIQSKIRKVFNHEQKKNSNHYGFYRLIVYQ